MKELAGFDFEAQPSIDPKQIRDLGASRWIAFADPVVATAILDRLLHHSHVR